MNGLLAIETSTDACSVAVLREGVVTQRHIIAPRQHNKLLFGLLSEVLAAGDLTAANFDAIAYGSGPGSFTGLRIAASAVQGLCYASGIPAVPVSTLATLAQHALRVGRVSDGDSVLCTLDARINEIYAAVYCYQNGVATLIDGPWVCAPDAIQTGGAIQLHVVGDGGKFLLDFPAGLQERVAAVHTDILPTARDVITLAQVVSASIGTQSPREVQPVYLRDEISWKKLSEQGKRS